MTTEITIPVLDEAATLDQQIRKVQAFLTEKYHAADRPRIIIADNGSSDGTFEIGLRLSQEFDEVDVLKVPRRGVGLALKTSWSQSTADIVGYMDLDLATDLSHFPQAIRAIENEGADLVYGSRLHPQSRVIGRSTKREIASRVFNFLLQQYLDVGFSDGMCGFKWLRRDIYEQLHAAGADNDGWFFSTELLTVAEWQNLRIEELPIVWTDDAASSKVKVLPLAKRYLRAMRRLKKRRKS